jgi:hypothetical protein
LKERTYLLLHPILLTLTALLLITGLLLHLMLLLLHERRMLLNHSRLLLMLVRILLVHHVAIVVGVVWVVGIGHLRFAHPFCFLLLQPLPLRLALDSGRRIRFELLISLL